MRPRSPSAQLVTAGALRIVIAAALLTAGCVKTYEPPKEGEAAAILKVKFAHNQTAARKFLPGDGLNPNLSVAVTLTKDEELVSFARSSILSTCVR